MEKDPVRMSFCLRSESYFASMHPKWVSSIPEVKSKTGILCFELEILLELLAECKTRMDRIGINVPIEGSNACFGIEIRGIDGKTFDLEYMFDSGGYFALGGVTQQYIVGFVRTPTKVKKELHELGFEFKSV